MRCGWGEINLPRAGNKNTHFEWIELEKYLQWEASIPKVENVESSELADEILRGSPIIEYGKKLLYIEVIHQDVDY